MGAYFEVYLDKQNEIPEALPTLNLMASSTPTCKFNPKAACYKLLIAPVSDLRLKCKLTSAIYESYCAVMTSSSVSAGM